MSILEKNHDGIRKMLNGPSVIGLSNLILCFAIILIVVSVVGTSLYLEGALFFVSLFILGIIFWLVLRKWNDEQSADEKIESVTHFMAYAFILQLFLYYLFPLFLQSLFIIDRRADFTECLNSMIHVPTGPILLINHCPGLLSIFALAFLLNACSLFSLMISRQIGNRLSSFFFRSH